ncbi:MAG: hypothetical protein ACOZBL_04530 [Patescibacteria group bacterium]
MNFEKILDKLNIKNRLKKLKNIRHFFSANKLYIIRNKFKKVHKEYKIL